MRKGRRQRLADVDVPLKKSEHNGVPVVETMKERVTRHFTRTISQGLHELQKQFTGATNWSVLVLESQKFQHRTKHQREPRLTNLCQSDIARITLQKCFDAFFDEVKLSAKPLRDQLVCCTSHDSDDFASVALWPLRNIARQREKGCHARTGARAEYPLQPNNAHPAAYIHACDNTTSTLQRKVSRPAAMNCFGTQGSCTIMKARRRRGGARQEDEEEDEKEGEELYLSVAKRRLRQF